MKSFKSLIKINIDLKNDIKNVMFIVSGTGFGKLIAILLTFFLAKLFNSEDFGVLAMFISTGAILTSLFTFRYEITILNIQDSENDKRGGFLKTNSLILSLLFFVIFVLLFFFNLFDNIVFLLIPLYSLITSWYEIERMYKVKKKNNDHDGVKP